MGLERERKRERELFEQDSLRGNLGNAWSIGMHVKKLSIFLPIVINIEYDQ